MSSTIVLWLIVVFAAPLVVFTSIFAYNFHATGNVRDAWRASWSSAWHVFKETFWWGP